MNLAKQSTAKTFLLGPILDADGVAKTDEVVASIKVTKNGTVGAPNGSSTLTHDHAGTYKYVANAGDIDTLGEVEFTLNSGTNAMAPVKFQVVPANVYDSLVAGSDDLDVNVETIATDAVTAAALKADAVTEIVNAVVAQAASFKADVSGLSTHDAAAVVTAMLVSAASFKADLSALATAANLATVDTVVDTIAARLTAARALLLDNLTDLDAPISGIGSSLGSGADTVTLTCNDGSGDPIADMDVWITSTNHPTASVVAGTLQTDSAGQVELLLDAGVSYWLWRQKDGLNLENPQSFVAVAD